MTYQNCAKLTILLFALGMLSISEGQQLYPWAQYIQPYVGMYGLYGHAASGYPTNPAGYYRRQPQGSSSNSHTGNYDSISNSITNYYNNHYRPAGLPGGWSQLPQQIPPRPSYHEDWRYHGDHMKGGFWLHCTSKNCSRGKK